MKSFGKRWNSRLNLILVIAVFVVSITVIVGLTHAVYLQGTSSYDKATLQWLEEQQSNLKLGKQSGILFYDSHHTDRLVIEFDRNPAIEELTFELTDLTDKGMQIVAALPNLKRLTIHGGRPGIGNEGLSLLRKNKTIVTLRLTNCNVTDDCLAFLKDLPELRSLSLHRDEFRDKLLTDKAVVHLQRLSGLRELHVSGGWMSTTAISVLQNHLHNCAISVTSDLHP